MYVPNFRVKRSGVPVLSKKEIDVIASKYVRDFQPEALVQPQEFHLEEFIECYLHMKPDYQYLSHNGIYLGMTVFNGTDKVIVYCPETNTAEYIHADAHTVIIDRRLIEDEKQEHRYRYTLGHEGGHEVFHSHIFSVDPNQISLLEPVRTPVIQCRVDTTQTRRVHPRNWTDSDWMEWHANVFSSAILMPSDAVKIIYESSTVTSLVAKNYMAISNMVEVFNVSTEAATYRLKDLGYIPEGDTNDYTRTSAYMDFIDIIGMEAGT